MVMIGLAIFLIAHGLVHSVLAIAPNPSDPDAKPGAFFTAGERSWLLPQCRDKLNRFGQIYTAPSHPCSGYL